MKLKLVDLDAQIDKLRELGDKELPAKSAIGNKKAKAQEIIKALGRHHSMAAEGNVEGGEAGKACNDTEG